MKTIKKSLLFLLLTILLMINYNCTETKCDDFQGVIEQDYCYYYPHRDTFHLGDTVYIHLAFPKLIKSNCGWLDLKDDSICTTVFFNLSDSTNLISSDDIEKGTVINTKGVHNGGKSFTFVYETESKTYVNEFYYILKDTSINYIGDFGRYLEIVLLNVRQEKNFWGKIEISGELVWTTFKGADRGGFPIHIEP